MAYEKRVDTAERAKYISDFLGRFIIKVLFKILILVAAGE